MRKLIFVFMVVGFAFILSANSSNAYAQGDPSGSLGGSIEGGTGELIEPQDGEFCIDYDFGPNTFTLIVNSSGHAHTSGLFWCQDWNPTGKVTVKDRLGKDRRIVKFNLSGTLPSDDCCESLAIKGKIVYKLSKDKLKRSKVEWSYPGECYGGWFMYKAKVKTGTLRDCR